MEVILRKGKYALIDRGHEYVVACGFDETLPENQQWEHGNYYTHWNESDRKMVCLQAALDHFRLFTDENYISRTRLEELATQFKDALLEDDKYSALVFFDDFCEMTESEKEWFGIDEEED